MIHNESFFLKEDSEKYTNKVLILPTWFTIPWILVNLSSLEIILQLFIFSIFRLWKKLWGCLHFKNQTLWRCWQWFGQTFADRSTNQSNQWKIFGWKILSRNCWGYSRHQGFLYVELIGGWCLGGNKKEVQLCIIVSAVYFEIKRQSLSIHVKDILLWLRNWLRDKKNG